MDGATQLLYLEPDDEITSVVRRLREAEADRVVLVAPGRSRVTTSAVALRLLAGVAEEEGRQIALVADPSGRSLAAEAGIAAFASVGEAQADDAKPAEPPPPRRAPIRVVRGEGTPPPPPAASAADAGPVAEPAMPPAAPAIGRGGPSDETQAVPVVRPDDGEASGEPPAAPRSGRPGRLPVRRPDGRRSALPRPTGAPLRRTLSGAAIGIIGAFVLVAAIVAAVVAPAATIVIEPASFAVDGVAYTLAMPPGGADEGELTADAQGTATGVHRDARVAAGEVTFLNYNTSTVRVSAGTRVTAGEIVFETGETVVVPTGFFTIPGTAQAGVTAVEPGPAANVAAGAIDTVLDEAVRNALRAFSDNPNRVVRNEEATTGGELNETPEITQQDVDAVVAEIQADLAGQLRDQLAEDPQRVYGPTAADTPVIDVPADLVGRRGEESFELSGTLSFHRAYLDRDAVAQAARDRLIDDATVLPQRSQVLPDTISVDVGDVTEDGEALRVRVTVTARAVPLVDVDAVRQEVAGMTGPEAAAALGSLGTVSVELWPGWVDRVPRLTWRTTVHVRGTTQGSGASASGSPGP